MSKYVAILHDGVITIHLPHRTGDYATLCNEDGDDPMPEVDLVEVDVPKGSKVNCVSCIGIWQVCKKYTIKDFEKEQG
jgi:hypothetical protein